MTRGSRMSSCFLSATSTCSVEKWLTDMCSLCSNFSYARLTREWFSLLSGLHWSFTVSAADTFLPNRLAPLSRNISNKGIFLFSKLNCVSELRITRIQIGLLKSQFLVTASKYNLLCSCGKGFLSFSIQIGISLLTFFR